MGGEYKSVGTPFFVGLGFHKPHLPFVFPARFLQYYPEGSVSLPIASRRHKGTTTIKNTRTHRELEQLGQSDRFNWAATGKRKGMEKHL